MNAKLVSIDRKELYILENLLQLYLYDISYYFPIDFDSLNGKYIYEGLEKYVDSSNDYAYFIKYENSIVGFILVGKDNDSYILQEIFVLNNFKNKGLGEDAVHKLFHQIGGEWIIKSLPCSTLAEKFWNKTISNYTDGKYKVEHVGKYNRAFFTFESIE